jgi:hypothetical protein
MHSTCVPLAKDPLVVIDKFRKNLVEEAAQRVGCDLSRYSGELGDKIRKLWSYDLVEELDDLLATTNRMKKTHVVMSHFDHHANNLLIKGGKIVDENSIKVVDMDIITYFYRGMDIGVYMFENSFDFSTLPDVTFVDLLPESSWRYFIKHYLEKWIELNPKKYDPSIDNVDHVLLEATVLSRFMSVLLIGIIMRSLHTDRFNLEHHESGITELVDFRIPLHIRQKELGARMFSSLYDTPDN